MNHFEQRKFTIKIYLYGYPKEQNKEKEFGVYARLTYLDEKTEISLRLKAKPSDFDFEHEMFQPLKKFNVHNNRKLEDAKTRFGEIFNELRKDGKEPSVKEIRKIFTGKTKQRSAIGLLEFFDSCIEERRQRRTEYAEGTIRHYNSSRNLLRDYLVAKYNINFKMVNLSIKFIVGYEQYLMSTPIKSSNEPRKRISANGTIKKLIAVVHEAVNKEVLDKYPFQEYKKKKEEPINIVYLTNEEIMALKKHDLGGNKSLQRVRDFFLFSIYSAGLRWGDASNLKPQNIRMDDKGIYWYSIQTQKTKFFHEMPLMKPAVEILNRYLEESKTTNNVLLRKVEQGSYLFANRNGFLDEATAHMKRNLFYSRDGVMEIAKKFKVLKLFREEEYGAYHYASKNGFINEATAHMKRAFSNHTRVSVMKIAKRFRTLKKFREEENGAHKYAYRNGFLNEATSHMQRKYLKKK